MKYTRELKLALTELESAICGATDEGEDHDYDVITEKYSELAEIIERLEPETETEDEEE